MSDEHNKGCGIRASGAWICEPGCRMYDHEDLSERTTAALESIAASLEAIAKKLNEPLPVELTNSSELFRAPSHD